MQGTYQTEESKMCDAENDISRLIDDVDSQVERIWEILSVQQSIQNAIRELQSKLATLEAKE